MAPAAGDARLESAMTDSTGFQAESHSATPDSSATATQLAQASGTVEVNEPTGDSTVIVAVEPGQTLHLDFDPAAAHGVVKDGNLELTFDNQGTVVVQGYEAWAAQGGGAAAQNAAQVCEIPNQ